MNFEKLKSRAGTKLSDPLLAQAGLEVSVGRIPIEPPKFLAAMKPPPQLLERNGVLVSDVKGAGISEVRLLDAEGKVKFHTSRALRTKNGLVFNLNGQSITDSTTLQIDVYTGAEPSVGEFELKDIRLP